MTATKFRQMAQRLQMDITAKRAPRNDNTPKRAKEAASARIEAAHLERVKIALEVLAEAKEDGTLPDQLAGIQSKSELLPMLATKIDCSGGYYSVVDTWKYRDMSPTAAALRQLIENRKGKATAEEQAVAARKAKIEQMEREVRFTTIPGFFPTPPEIVEMMLQRAEIVDGMRVLEPSAGIGSIAEMIRDKYPRCELLVGEIRPVLRTILNEKSFTLIFDDFLGFELFDNTRAFQRIIMNPPFECGQDVEHVRHAYDLLGENGRLVSITSAGPFFRQDRKAVEFREWLGTIESDVEDLPADAFKNAFRSTAVSCKLVTIWK